MRPDARRRLGDSDVTVSALGLGCASLGNLYAPVSDEAATATVARALGLGIRYLDTAPYYGYGLSEERVARALAATPRDDFVISTKVGRLLDERSGEARSDQGFVDANCFDPVFDYSYEGVMRSFESSLERLGVDRVDVLLMHDIGAATHGGARHRELFEVAITEGIRAMQGLRESGAVRAIGLGVNECAVCIEALGRVDLDCLLLAGRYTLLEQGALEQLLPLCDERGTSVIVGGPFNSGILVEGSAEPHHYDYAAAPSEILERVERLREVCAGHATPLPAAALHFPLRHPAVACVIPGARTPAEIEANASWLAHDVPAALFRDLQDAELLDRRAPIEEPA
jgi:D-threo-aldose 1-dehydrogenase